MTDRKKRIEKGIKSLEKQIEIHKEKIKNNEGSGDLILKNYWEKEIKNLEKRKAERKRLLEKL